MKVWRFYIKEQEETTHAEKYNLYALTNHKKYAEQFQRERNMKKFVIKTSKMSREEYSALGNQNNNCVLREEKLITKDIENGLYTHREVKILLTYYEYQCSSGEDAYISINTPEWWYGIPTYKIFNDSTIKRLRLLYYVGMYKIMSDNPQLNHDDDDYSVPDVYTDELAMFIRTFGKTF